MKREHRLVDMTFGLQKQSIELGKLLAKIDITKIEGYEQAVQPRAQASAWYNGRERGIALTFRAFNRPTFVIAFSECRNTDAIVIDNWCLEKEDINPVTVADFQNDADYHRRKFVECERYENAAMIILELIEGWFDGKEGKCRY